jgi:uncharacterized membrane protein
MNAPIMFALLSIAAPCALAAEGSWTVCNRSAKDVQVSIAYVNPGSRGGFISEGWWKLRACGGCATRMTSFTCDVGVRISAESALR